MKRKKRNEITCQVLEYVELAVMRVRDQVGINIVDNHTILNALAHEINLLIRDRRK